MRQLVQCCRERRRIGDLPVCQPSLGGEQEVAVACRDQREVERRDLLCGEYAEKFGVERKVEGRIGGPSARAWAVEQVKFSWIDRG